MPSKKSRAKARKAKKAADEGIKISGDELEGRRGGGLSQVFAAMNVSGSSQNSAMVAGGSIPGSDCKLQCHHGRPSPVPPICHSIVAAFQDDMKKCSPHEPLIHLLMKGFHRHVIVGHWQILASEALREDLRSFLSSEATDLLWEYDTRSHKTGILMKLQLSLFTFLLLVLEDPDFNEGMKQLAEGRFDKLADGEKRRAGADWARVEIQLWKIIGGGQRESIRFYKRRVPCDCLKGLYKEEKLMAPKKGFCSCCKGMTNGYMQDMERSKLLLCSKCRVAEYCSKQCQASHWPIHKGSCAKWAAENAAKSGGGAA